MCAKKKKDCFLRVDGFEKWMNQFFVDSYANNYDPNGIQFDLFETEQSYILEAELPSSCKNNISIRKTSHGITILVYQQRNCIIERNIELPINVMNKIMKATFENGLLDIQISKTEDSNDNIAIEIM